MDFSYMGYSGLALSTLSLVAVSLVTAMVLAARGLKRKDGTLMLAAGSWALSFVGSAYASGITVNIFFAFVVFPVMGAFGVTFLILGLREIFR